MLKAAENKQTLREDGTPYYVQLAAIIRRQIAEIAVRQNVWLVEDDLYGAMTDDPTPLLTEFAPDDIYRSGVHPAQLLDLLVELGFIPELLTTAGAVAVTRAEILASGKPQDIRWRRPGGSTPETATGWHRPKQQASPGAVTSIQSSSPRAERKRRSARSRSARGRKDAMGTTWPSDR